MNAKRVAPADRAAKPVDPTVQAAAGDLTEQQVNLDRAGASSAPKMPHERDESSGATGGAPDARVQQAAIDVAQGRQDTSRGEATERAYRAQKKPKR